MELLLFKHGRRVAGVLAALGVLWIGTQGIHRSLWLDEAWVANSIHASSLAEMFWRGEWLQTSPPLFLLIARAAVGVFGLSTETLRAVPLLFACIAGIAIWRAAGRIAPLAVAALLFPSVAVEYFGAFKQYGAEAAAVTLALWATVEYRRLGFVWYCAIITGLLPLAYPLAFLLPGLIWFVWREDGVRRAVILATSAGAMLTGLYFFFIQPNVEPSLWSYWSGSFDEAYTPGVWLWIAASAFLTIRAALQKKWVAFACALPCLLLVAAELLGWYPASPRTRLFVRPCFILAAAMFLEEFRDWKWLPSAVAIALTVFAVSTYRSEPFEDYPAAVAYLRAHVAPGDLLLVHPDARQGLLLYAPDLPARYGNTGWPCCARGRVPVKSTEAAVQNDLARLVPPEFRGRVWLFYANRPLHWEYLGLNEGELWRKLLWDRGCPPEEYVALPNIAISPMQCGAR
ncbi:MAG: hypothetical protein ABIR70_15930 [Bryobacteraceae bacterium]